jgi:adenylate cyclase
VVVQELLVDRGDAVHKGQLLATIDTAELQAAMVKEKESERVTVLEAQRDRARDELWLTLAEDADAGVSELRVPASSGIAGYAAHTAETVRVDDAYANPRFNPDLDRRTGFRTRTILCVPLLNAQGEVFAVSQLLNRRDGKSFDAEDERRFKKFLGPIAVMLETWWRMTRLRRGG